jgi:parallel beta-helix repeat protein
MQKVIIIIFLSVSINSNARNFYVKNGGNDANTGLSDKQAWATISKVNKTFSQFAPGDSILFKRGNTFIGTIVVAHSGASGNPIVIGAYGTGANPVVTGFKTISGWTNEGKGIYSKVIISATQTNMVTINGVQYGMGRTPDSTYLYYENCNSNISITDNQLAADPVWTGAEVVIRKMDWVLDRCTITAQTGTTLTYTSLGSREVGTPNWGYFIQNDLRCVTRYGEWYHNKALGKFYMYFGAVDPATKSVKVATVNYLISNNSYDYIVVDNINFAGSIDNAVNFSSGNDNCSILNCSVDFSGKNGITLIGNNNLIDNNTVYNINRGGVVTSGTGNTIQNNRIHNIGIIKGQAFDSEYTDGIYALGANTVIRYNRIENTGYNGVFLDHNGDQTVQYNFVNNVCLVLDDGGGLYTSGSDPSGTRRIDHNIFLNAKGNNDGTSFPRHIYCEGIYCDSHHENIQITNNTVYGCGRSGIFIHDGKNDIITGNTCFNNLFQIYFQQYLTDPLYKLQNNAMYDNKFISKLSTQTCLRVGTGFSTRDVFVKSDNNYFTRPIKDTYTFEWYIGDWTPHTLADWKTKSGQDSHSKGSPFSISDTSRFAFYYNAGKTNREITLTSSMSDITGKKYTSTITLLPYTSVVLIKDPNTALNRAPSIPNQTFQVGKNSLNFKQEITKPCASNLE